LIGYLKRNRDLKMVFRKGKEVMQLWSDANWGGNTSGQLQGIWYNITATALLGGLNDKR
jgi:hypothetical protein